jgi:hypothetical protein
MTNGVPKKDSFRSGSRRIGRKSKASKKAKTSKKASKGKR